MEKDDLISTDFCDQVAIHLFDQESDLLASIDELSYCYNHDPIRLADLYQRPNFISAYLYFFFATNVTKGRALFQQLQLQNQITHKMPWVEFGAGPGTLSVAAFSHLKQKECPLLLLESSQYMRQQADKVFEAIDADYPVMIAAELHDEDWLKNYRGGILCFGHSYNEISDNHFFRLIDQYDPQCIWLVEPGTPKVFERVLRVRSELIRRGFTVQYPCLHQSYCPMREDPQNWCHQYQRVSHHYSIERLCQLLRKDRRLLASTHFLFTKNTQNVDAHQAQLIQVLKETKHSYEWQVCLKIEGKLELCYWQVAKRGLETQQKKALSQCLAGQRFAYQIDKKIREDYWRVFVDLS